MTDTAELESVYFARLNTLILSDNKLKELGSLAMPDLTYLDLSNNELKLINSIPKLTTLENLILKNNHISSLPDLSCLADLETLDLSDNELDIFPRLASSSLLYIDLSGNHLTGMPGLSRCTALKESNLLGQTYETACELNYGDLYTVDPVPELISRYGDDGAAIITDSDGQTAYQKDFAELTASEYGIDTGELPRAGKYDLVITGHKGGELLGTYTYHLVLNGGSSPLLIGGIIAVAAGAAVIIWLLKRKKRVE